MTMRAWTAARRGWRTWLMMLAAVALVAVPALAQERAAPGMSEFSPVNSLPPDQRMPDGPLLIALYAVIWVALLLFLWAIWRRLGKVDGELSRVEGPRK
jgi:cytochrome bd-type quinol oxidase subunit 2